MKIHLVAENRYCVVWWHEISVFVSEIVRLLMSMQVDRINQQRIFWSGKYVNPNSKEYKTLEGESNYAVSSKNYFVHSLEENISFYAFLYRKNFSNMLVSQT